MARPPASAADVPESLFQSEPRPSAASQFWLSVGRYRPVLLVGGVWLVLICLAAVAYNRLMFTGAPPPVNSSAEVQGRSPISLDGSNLALERPSPAGQSPANRPANGSPLGPIDTASPAAPARPPNLVPAWSLGLLVGLCALSCLGVSSGARAARLRTKRQATSAAKSKAIQSSSQAARLRLPTPAAKPIRRQTRPSDSPRRSAAGRGQAPPRSPSQTVRGSRRPGPVPPPLVTGNLAHKVAVIPDDQAHPLDWQEASLADNLDLRQRRSLSSLL